MRIFISILISITCYITACREDNCRLDQINKINWDRSDSIIEYKLCSSSNNKLTEKDSVTIEYLGTLKKEDNILVQRPMDSLIFCLSTNMGFGKFIRSDTNNSFIKKIVGLMSKNSEAILQFDLSKLPPIKDAERKITVFFREQPDSVTACNYIRTALKKEFYDSLKYISKETTIGLFSGINDTTWKSFLNNNPLPVSVEVFVKKKYFIQAFFDSLDNYLSNKQLVSEIIYPSKESFDFIYGLGQLTKQKILIRVRS